MSEITLDETIRYLKEASEREKNEQFSKFVEESIELIKLYGDYEAETLIELFLELTDEYIQTKNAELLKEMVEDFDE
jgi:hypothetical protein